MYHVGIVVPDLDAARAHFTELLGVEWGPVAENEIQIRDGDGNEFVVPNRICYSLVVDSGRLGAVACPLELLDGHGDAPPSQFTYHRDPLGVRVELVNIEIRPMMEQFMFRAAGMPDT